MAPPGLIGPNGGTPDCVGSIMLGGPHQSEPLYLIDERHGPHPDDRGALWQQFHIGRGDMLMVMPWQNMEGKSFASVIEPVWVYERRSDGVVCLATFVRSQGSNTLPPPDKEACLGLLVGVMSGIFKEGT